MRNAKPPTRCAIALGSVVGPREMIEVATIAVMKDEITEEDMTVVKKEDMTVVKKEDMTVVKKEEEDMAVVKKEDMTVVKKEEEDMTVVKKEEEGLSLPTDSHATVKSVGGRLPHDRVALNQKH
eukprot:GHVH01011180.1.p3 GENE.GHVH01011180.1~~GHVH01011180.1.p3  ORF type:complete len:124 (-),score=36.92 GHVH01011180.1:185-556(-)